MRGSSGERERGEEKDRKQRERDNQRKKERMESQHLSVCVCVCACVCLCTLYPSQQWNICPLPSCMRQCPVTMTLSAIFCHFVFACDVLCVCKCARACVCVCNPPFFCVRLFVHMIVLVCVSALASFPDYVTLSACLNSWVGSHC